jgi:asparagine synthase (glutamine-hydrolysing)
MCGIAGVMGYGGAAIPDLGIAVQRMQSSIAHRGPDGAGDWQHDRGDVQVGLAHTRLAILDLSAGGAQPMRRGDAVVSYNGEIYNFKALRHELAQDGAAFRTDSDTEVLLAAYERWGADALVRLHGMFAFALWDGARGRLLLARDRLGVKPLYYARGMGWIAFASEVRALLASGLVAPALDERALWDYLGHQTAATPATLLRGVSMLEPGHVLDVTAAGPGTPRQYWNMLDAAAAAGTAPVTAAAARDRVRAALVDAVVSHTVSDVPVGVFLSGGIDSGALVSLLRSAGVTARTFTVAVGDHPQDESAAAAGVAAAFGAEHTAIQLSEDACLEMLPEVLAAIDHPSGDGVNTWIVARAVRERGISVALSGLGGDEIFGGYPSFRRLGQIAPAAARWGRSPRALRRLAASVVRAGGGEGVAGVKLADAVESDGTLDALWPVTRQLFSVRQRRDLLPESRWPAGDDDPYGALIRAAATSHPGADLWARVSHAEARAYMHDVLLRDADQMSMAHALEVRVPLLDHRLVELVTSIPAAIKRHGRPKSLLIDSLPAPLPPAIRAAPKRGFTLPFEAWMRGALRPFCERQLGDDGLEGRRLLRPGAVRAIWQDFLARRSGVTWSRVWMLVALNAWLERHGIAGEAA